MCRLQTVCASTTASTTVKCLEDHHAYPHAPNRPLFGRPAENLTYDITGRQFIAEDLKDFDPIECEEDPVDRKRRRLLPNVIGLGVKKCGTTALHYYMKE